MIRFSIVGFFCCLLAVQTSSVSAQTASVAVSTDSVLVGERFFFTAVVRAEQGQIVVFPDLSDGPLSIGDAEFIRRVSEPGPPASSDSADFEVAVFGADSALVGGLPIAIIQADGDTLFFSSPTVQVGIRSTVPAEAEGLKDLAPLATFPRALWPWIVGTILALVAAWFLFGYLKKRASRSEIADGEIEQTVDPYNEAVARLGALADTRPEGEESLQLFHDELSDILRTYIEKTLSLPALERTTSEILFSLGQFSQIATDYVSEDVVERVGESLNLSDLVKFANYISQEAENRRALELTRFSIEDIEGGRRRRLAVAEAEAEAAAEVV
jgi:hypothetical protein